MEKNLRQQYGLDAPTHVRYAKWMWRMMRGDLGLSLEFGEPVTQVIGERLLLTVILAGTTALICLGVIYTHWYIL